MGQVAERWKIEAVLALVRSTPFDRFYVAGSHTFTSKTHLFLKRIGYDNRCVHREVQGLTVRNYAAGPLLDVKGRPHDLWIFGKYISASEVYIKLVAYLCEGGVRSVCVSFHEAESPLSYPYRKAS